MTNNEVRGGLQNIPKDESFRDGIREKLKSSIEAWEMAEYSYPKDYIKELADTMCSYIRQYLKENLDKYFHMSLYKDDKTFSDVWGEAFTKQTVNEITRMVKDE